MSVRTVQSSETEKKVEQVGCLEWKLGLSVGGVCAVGLVASVVR